MNTEQVKYAYGWLGVKLRAAGIPTSEIADLTQEAILGGIVKFRQFDSGRAKWKTFLCLCLSHSLADILRRRRKLITCEALDFVPDLPAEIEINEIFESLPLEIDRQIAALRWQGATQKKVLYILGISRQEYLLSLARIRQSIVEHHRPCDAIGLVQPPSPPLVGTFTKGGGQSEVGA